MLGAEIRCVMTPTYGRIRIAEAVQQNSVAILFQHGLNGHLEAYAKNLMALSSTFYVIAFDYVGHGLSDKTINAYSPAIFAEQLLELMDVLQIESAHLSGESLGGAGCQACSRSRCPLLCCAGRRRALAPIRSSGRI